MSFGAKRPVLAHPFGPQASKANERSGPPGGALSSRSAQEMYDGTPRSTTGPAGFLSGDSEVRPWSSRRGMRAPQWPGGIRLHPASGSVVLRRELRPPS